MGEQLREVAWRGKTFRVPTVWSRGALWYRCPFCEVDATSGDKLGKHIVLDHLKTTHFEDIRVEYIEVRRDRRKRFRCLDCEFEGDLARDIITHDLELHRPASVKTDADKPAQRGKSFNLAAKVAQWKLQSPSGLTPEQERHRAEIKQEAVAQLHREAEALLKSRNAANLEQSLEARAATILTEMYRDIEEFENHTAIETEQEIGSDMVWELDESGQRRIPSRETLAVFAPRDEWQHRAGAVWPNQQVALREELRQALEQVVILWRRKSSTRFSGLTAEAHEGGDLSSHRSSPGSISSAEGLRGYDIEEDLAQTIEAGSIPSGESWGTPPTDEPHVEPGSIPSSEEWGHPIVIKQVDFKPQNYVVEHSLRDLSISKALERDLFRLARRIQLLEHPVAPAESPDRWIQTVRFNHSPLQTIDILDLVENSAIWCEARALGYLDDRKLLDAQKYDGFAHQFREMARAVVEHTAGITSKPGTPRTNAVTGRPSPTVPVNKRKGGRPADAEANWKIARILSSFRDWRKDLVRACARLERAKIAIPNSKKWKQKGCVDWSDILQEDEAGLIRALQHRLDWVARNPAPG